MVIDYDPDLNLGRRLDEYESSDPLVRAADFMQDYRDAEETRRKLKEDEGNEYSLVEDSKLGGRDLQAESDLILDFAVRRCSFVVR